MACRLLNPRSLSTSVLAYIWFSHLKKGNSNKTTKVFIKENVFENDTYIIIKFIFKFKWNCNPREWIFEIISYKMAIILCGPEYINCVWDEIAAMF